MNKKADAPTLMLFVVTLSLIIVALFSFASFSANFAQTSEGRSQMLSNLAFYESYIIKESEITAKDALLNLGLIKEEGFVGPILPIEEAQLKEKFKEMLNKDFKIAGLENFFEKIRNNDFKFKENEEGYIFQIDNILLTSQNNANKIARHFSLEMLFDKNGNAIQIIS